MADFQQAIKWLKEGKKVRRKSFGDIERYCYISMANIEKIADSHYSIFDLNFEDFLANDWEIYCEEHEFRTGYFCQKCDHKMNEDHMGKRCPNCEEWTYTHKCYQENVCKNCGIKKHEVLPLNGSELNDLDYLLDLIVQGNRFTSLEIRKSKYLLGRLKELSEKLK